MDVSDRIAVMYEGKIIDIVDANNTSETELGLLMAGVSREQIEKQKEENRLEEVGIDGRSKNG
jgi:ABC-type sugar transport system ATPase subunit